MPLDFTERIFDKPEDVPKDEGWVVSPALVGATKSQIAAAAKLDEDDSE